MDTCKRMWSEKQIKNMGGALYLHNVTVTISGEGKTAYLKVINSKSAKYTSANFGEVFDIFISGSIDVEDKKFVALEGINNTSVPGLHQITYLNSTSSAVVLGNFTLVSDTVKLL